MNMHTTMEPPGALQLREARRHLRFRRLVALFERDEIEEAVDTLIAHLDRMDGDLDVEANGDEQDDPGDLTDISYSEWHTRGPKKLDGYGAEPSRTVFGNLQLEDDEDEDPAEDDGEDRCPGGDDHMIAGPVTQRDGWERHEQLSGHLPGDDVDAEPEDHVTSRAFRDAIRRTRCTKVVGRDMYGREYVSRYELEERPAAAAAS